MQVLDLCLVIYLNMISSTSYPLVWMRPQKWPRPPKLPLPGPVSEELCFTSELGSFKDRIPSDNAQSQESTPMRPVTVEESWSINEGGHENNTINQISLFVKRASTRAKTEGNASGSWPNDTPLAQRLSFDAFFSLQLCSNSGAVRRAPSTQDCFHRTRYCLRGLPRPCFTSLSSTISPSQLCRS